jgi:hypothetical protein
MRPLMRRVCACPSCGLTGLVSEFITRKGSASSFLSRARREATRYGDGPGTASEQYEAAANLLEAEGGALVEVADLLLHAAWCCVDEGDVEAERFFRRQAATKFEEALDSFDVSPPDRAVITYLVGELWRRSGDSRRARQWFDQVESEIIDPDTQRWIQEVALQQRDAPQEWFAHR